MPSRLSVASFERVSYTYPPSKVPALRDFDLRVPQSASLALLGPNGAGKTTMLRLLCGLLGDHFLGKISIAEPLRNSKGFLLASRAGILLESPGIYPRLTVEEYLMFFGKFYAVKDLDARIKFLADRLEFSLLDRKMGTLSPGNRQKVQIIRAFLHRPSFLILDEPVANLDPVSRKKVWNLLEDWKKEEGGTAIICSHILKEIEEWATHYAIIHEGHVVECMEMENLCKESAWVTITLHQKIEEIPFSIREFYDLSHLCLKNERVITYHCDFPETKNPFVVRELCAAGCEVVSVIVHRKSLEEAYQKSIDKVCAH